MVQVILSVIRLVSAYEYNRKWDSQLKIWYATSVVFNLFRSAAHFQPGGLAAAHQ